MKMLSLHGLMLAVSLAAFSTGCASDPGAAEDDVEELGESEGALAAAKEHFAPIDVELNWVPGCGMRRPDGEVCYMGLELTFSKLYRDLRVSTRTTVNNTKDTIKVKLDTYSTGGPHALAPVMPETKELGRPSRLMMTKVYAATVVDWQNNVLWSGDIHPFPAP